MKFLQAGRIFLLSLWAAFFLWLITLGQSHLARLLHPGLWWLVGAASVILLLLLFVNFKRHVNYDPRGVTFIEFSSLFILLIPLLYFTHVRTARFNEATLSTRTVQMDNISLADEFSRRVAREIEEDETRTRETSLTRLFLKGNKYVGKEVEVVCRTFVNEQLPENQVMCYRYLITCCAADAQPVFVFLNSFGKDPITNDQWVRVKGVVSMIGEPGRQVASISPDSIEYVDEPKFPYAY